jgi:hypothetical protein
MSKAEFYSVRQHGAKERLSGVRGRARRELAETESNPELLEILSRSKDVVVRQAVAGNSHTPAVLLATLARDDDWRVQISVAHNSSTPLETLREFATEAIVTEGGFFDGKYSWGYALSSNPSATVDVLESVVRTDSADGNGRRRAIDVLTTERLDSRYYGMNKEVVSTILISGATIDEDDLEQIKSMPVEWVKKMFGKPEQSEERY